MTINEARIIFKSWQDYMEIAAKFQCLMLNVPESFLPYPADVLEEALNIIAKSYFDSGNKRMSENIKGTMSYLLPFFMTNAETGARQTEEEVITNMKKTLDLIEHDNTLKRALLKSLKECQDSWIKSRMEQIGVFANQTKEDCKCKSSSQSYWYQGF